MTNIGRHNNMMTSHQTMSPLPLSIILPFLRCKQSMSTNSTQLIQPIEGWVQNHFFSEYIQHLSMSQTCYSNFYKQRTEMTVILACSLETKRSKGLLWCKIHKWHHPVRSESSQFLKLHPFWVCIWSVTFSICHDLNLVISTKTILRTDQKIKTIIPSWGGSVVEGQAMN